MVFWHKKKHLAFLQSAFVFMVFRLLQIVLLLAQFFHSSSHIISKNLLRLPIVRPKSPKLIWKFLLSLPN